LLEDAIEIERTEKGSQDDKDKDPHEYYYEGIIDSIFQNNFIFHFGALFLAEWY